jgi:hypothetical protein
MSGTTLSSASSFFNMSLPNQLSFLTATAAYNPSSSAFTSGGFDYQPALTPELLSDAFAENAATQNAGLAAIANSGAAEFGSIGGELNNWAGAQNAFMTSVAQSFSEVASKSAKAGGGLLGFLGL